MTRDARSAHRDEAQQRQAKEAALVLSQGDESAQGTHVADLSVALSEPPPSDEGEDGSATLATMSLNRALSSVLLLATVAFADLRTGDNDERVALAWFTAIRNALDEGRLDASKGPEFPADSEARSSGTPEPVSAVSVILRLDGRPVGMAWRAGPETAKIWDAATDAMSQAMADPRVAALPADLRSRLGERLTLELELAGGTVPVIGDRLDQMAARAEPGLEALAIRNGDRWAFAMPGMLQARNQAGLLPFLSLGLAREAGLDLRGAKDLALPEGAGVYRAPTIRLVQRRPDASATGCLRGGPPHVPFGADAATVQAMAAALATHLERRWPRVEGLDAVEAGMIEALGPRALYRPAMGTWGDPVSPPVEQALAALAMARWAEAPWVHEAERARARDFVRRTIDSLRRMEPGEIDPAGDPTAAACVVLAARAWSQRRGAGTFDAETATWIARLASGLASRLDAGELQGVAEAMAVSTRDDGGGAARMLSIPEPGVSAERLLLISPWLDTPWPPVAASAWPKVLDGLTASQIDARSETGVPADLHGGWGESGSGRPSASTARAAWALAAALLRCDGLDARRRAEGCHALRMAMGFLRRLQVDDFACHAFRDPAKAIGGVRATPWDSDLSMAAAAWTLLACVDAVPALEACPEADGSTVE
jgi:hypothetical protein